MKLQEKACILYATRQSIDDLKAYYGIHTTLSVIPDYVHPRFCPSISSFHDAGTERVVNFTYVGLTTVPYTATAVQNTVPYGCGPYRNRTRIRKTQALDGTVTAINGRITAPYGSTSII